MIRKSKLLKQSLSFTFLAGIFLLITLSVCGQIRKDTLFLYRKISANDYQAIFIDNKKSHLYNEIVRNITIDTFNYNSVFQGLKDSVNGTIYTFKLNIPTEWCSLHQYKKKYYAYLPSEPYFNTYLR